MAEAHRDAAARVERESDLEDDDLETGGPSGRPLPASRHYRRAQRDRGSETRTQLLEAALDLFGRRGFDGASTREIAKAAGANLAAIVYHFGSKEALHIAVAEHVVRKISERIAPLIDEAASIPDDPAKARDMLRRLMENQVEVMLDGDGSERWSRFLVREHMQPTAAFEVVYRMLNKSIQVYQRLLAIVLRRPVDDEEVIVRTFSLFGQIMVFRVSHALILRHAGWREMGDRERREISRVILRQIDAILDAETAP
jgi:AcrR family transcriptional regulator